MRRLKHQLQFLRSAATAARHLASFYGIYQALRISVNVVSELLKSRHAAWFWSRRMRTCYRCRMFNRRLRTCGTPGEVYSDPSGGVETLGCWCLMPLKARLPDATCWARERGLGFGWQP